MTENKESIFGGDESNQADDGPPTDLYEKPTAIANYKQLNVLFAKLGLFRDTDTARENDLKRIRDDLYQSLEKEFSGSVDKETRIHDFIEYLEEKQYDIDRIPFVYIYPESFPLIQLLKEQHYMERMDTMEYLTDKAYVEQNPDSINPKLKPIVGEGGIKQFPQGSKNLPELTSILLGRGDEALDLFENRDTARIHLMGYVSGKTALLDEEILTNAGVTLSPDQKSELAAIRDIFSHRIEK